MTQTPSSGATEHDPATPVLRIVVADDEAEMREYLQHTLTELGHEVVAAAATGAELLEKCRETSPDLAVTDVRMPEMDGLEAADELRKNGPLPIIVVSAFSDDDSLDRALRNHVLTYLVKPIKKDDLKAGVKLAIQRFKEFQALQQQSNDLRQALEDRKLVERAKGILMTRANLAEPDAFRRLQKISSEKNRKMVEVARMIIEAEEVFEA